MSVAARLAAFVLVLAALFGVGAAAGSGLDPDRDEPSAAHGEDEGMEMAEGHDVRGLAVAEDGLRLRLATTRARRGATTTLRFAISGPGGETVRDFDVEHTRRMHVIVVRRDLAGFQHLHPRQGRDGSWSVPVRLDAAGTYRVFADFARDGEKHPLAADLGVDGPSTARPLRAVTTTTSVDGYVVRRHGTDFAIERDGAPVRPEPYLGAAGHLVALREGDLAFLHVHPEEGGRPRFETEFPGPGRYRLFLQFRHAGAVHTAEFTEEVRP